VPQVECIYFKESDFKGGMFPSKTTIYVSLLHAWCNYYKFVPFETATFGVCVFAHFLEEVFAVALGMSCWKDHVTFITCLVEV
jgi:hypothetical protein